MSEAEIYWKQYDPDTPVIFFGAKDAGVHCMRLLKNMRKNPVCFCDNDIHKQGTILEGLPVCSPQKALEQYPNAILIICTHNRYNAKNIQKQLYAAGFSNISNYIELLVRYQEFLYSQNFFESWNANQYYYLPSVGLDITRRCTLNCKQCSSLLPFFSHPEDFNAEQIIADVQTFLKYPVVIEQILLNGGEPLLHPELEKICATLGKSPQILRIQLITNGTILPEDALMKCFHQYNVGITVSNYGSLSHQLQNIVEAGKKYDVPVFILDPSDMWVDFGEPVLRTRTEEDHEKVFHQCFHWIQGLWIMERRLFICALSAARCHVGAVNPGEGDCLDLYEDLPWEEKRKKLELFLAGSTMPNACRYCNSRHAPGITPAIQSIPNQLPGGCIS